jgi:hypothetical protein
LVGKPEGKNQLFKTRRREEDNIKMYLKEIGWPDWFNLAQNMDLRQGVGVS